ncbi:MAG: 16S rRNA (guanine(966)-N(2))-methyltransferase RsmD [Planctomycetes bacterium]|nr:16S rRNA (guanine(966)-N(2))-methyltransferase RsmD [Planctomycetota bacterium]
MRIVAGRFGGRRLSSAPGTRPTGERVREAIFSRLGPEVEGARVLDLYAGSGALGFEALSRGAESVVLVENNGRAVAAIEANIKTLSVSEEVRCLKCHVGRAAQGLADGGEVFDLVLVDPPYAESAGLDEHSPLARAVIGLAEAGRLSAEALVVVEHRRQGAGKTSWPGFEAEAERDYGDTRVTFLRYRGGGEGARGEE